MSSTSTVQQLRRTSRLNSPSRISRLNTRSTRRPSVIPVPRQMMDLQTKTRQIHGHKCDLPRVEDQIHYAISDGWFVLLRRKFWKWLTVCPSDPDSKRFLKSSAEIQIEEMRHLSKHFHMIHPFSRGRFFWEMLMIPIFLMLFCVIPMECARNRVDWRLVYVKIVLDVVSYIDIILFFFTGYYDIRRQTVIMDHKQVARRYLFGFFIVDVVTSLPYSLAIKLFDVHGTRKYQLVKIIMLLKLVRMPTLIRYLRKFSEHMNLWGNYIKFINFILWVWILIAWTTCVFYAVFLFQTTQSFKENEERYKNMEHPGIPMLMTCYDVVRGLLTVGITERQNISDLEMIFQIIVLILGGAFNMVILAKVMQVFQRTVSSRNKYTSLLDEIDEYMRYKELPARLKEKVFNYVDFKFQKRIFREDDILHTLSSVLKQDILMHTCQTMIETVEFFKDLPTSVMLRLVTKLRSEVYLPNDIIVMAGYTGHAMYFIYTGTVAVYTSTGKEICHLEDGSHFGEIALVYNEPRVATVVAVTECEVFKLNRKDFQEAIEPFPVLNRQIREQAMIRLEKTMKMMQETQSVLTFDEDIDFTSISSTVSIL